MSHIGFTNFDSYKAWTHVQKEKENQISSLPTLNAQIPYHTAE
jgi:hypothetical protein